jgi:hypothetical protein
MASLVSVLTRKRRWLCMGSACTCVRACVFVLTYFARSAAGLAKYAVGLRLILTSSRSPWTKYTLPLVIESCAFRTLWEHKHTKDVLEQRRFIQLVKKYPVVKGRLAGNHIQSITGLYLDIFPCIQHLDNVLT